MATEKRLIDTSELVKKINKLDVFYFTGEADIQNHDCQMVELCAVLAEIDETPTSDAVEVVRCKDCQSWHKQIKTCDEFTTDRLPSGGRIAFVTSPNDYCSFAKKKTGGADNGL